MRNVLRDFARASFNAALAVALLAGVIFVSQMSTVKDIARAQGFVIPDLAVVNGHWAFAQAGTGIPPVGTTCTIAAGSTDAFGSCATTSTAAVITFNRTWGVSPFCLITDATSVSATSMPIYTVSATAITLSTVITAHTLFWSCGGKVGTT